jgi:hypothetical protein
MSFSAPMSTNPDTVRRADDRLVTLLSRWLARHVDDEELRRGVTEIGTADLSPEQAEAVHELVAELEHPAATPADREMVVRETLEALALGG